MLVYVCLAIRTHWITVLHIFSSVLEQKDCIMSTKHIASGSAGAIKPKKCRKPITLDTKLEILKKTDEGMRLKERQEWQRSALNTMSVSMWPVSNSKGVNFKIYISYICAYEYMYICIL